MDVDGDGWKYVGVDGDGWKYLGVVCPLDDHAQLPGRSRSAHELTLRGPVGEPYPRSCLLIPSS